MWRHARDPAVSYHWSVGQTPLTRVTKPSSLLRSLPCLLWDLLSPETSHKVFSHQSSWALPFWLLRRAVPLSSSLGIFFPTRTAESCKLQLQQTKRTSPYSSDARSCVAPEQLASAAVLRLANSKSRGPTSTHKAAYFAGTKPCDQFTARMVPFSFGTKTAQDGSPNHQHRPSRTGNVELGSDSIILPSPWPVTVVTPRNYSGLSGQIEKVNRVNHY